MKKFIGVIIVLTLLSMGFESSDLVRFTVINKSGRPLGMWLYGVNHEQFYYLTVEAGSKANPVTKTFTIVADVYQFRAAYLEIYDPVYGFQCVQPLPTLLFASRNTRLVFLECGQRPAAPGEPSMMKFWIWRWKYIF